MEEGFGIIDVIVPVYRGYEETVRCVSSVLASTCRNGFEVVVIDDAGPEPSLREWLNGIAREGRITLLTNDSNLGFVASVNRGMAHHPDRDAILLNSDCEVAGDWLDRLARCVASDPMVATATPFSNNATICSYPLGCRNNEMPEAWSVADLDALFAVQNASLSVVLPTAVGSCIYIRRTCWVELGGFDVERFGRGYGEECDFSMRARAAGWKNLLCADVFVYHEGSVSFGDERLARIAAAEGVMSALHPSYAILVTDFVHEDPAFEFRHRVSRARARRSAADARQVVEEMIEEQRIRTCSMWEYVREFARVEAVLTNAVDEARAQFGALDAALADAQRFVREREHDLAVVRSERDALAAALDELKCRSTLSVWVKARRHSNRLLGFLRRL